MCLIVSSSTPLSSAAFFTSMCGATSPNRLSTTPASASVFSTAIATRSSLPGALRTHMSAFDAVRDWRGSTWMKVPARPSRKLCIRAKPFA